MSDKWSVHVLLQYSPLTRLDYRGNMLYVWAQHIMLLHALCIKMHKNTIFWRKNFQKFSEKGLTSSQDPITFNSQMIHEMTSRLWVHRTAKLVATLMTARGARFVMVMVMVNVNLYSSIVTKSLMRWLYCDGWSFAGSISIDLLNKRTDRPLTLTCMKYM